MEDGGDCFLLHSWRRKGEGDSSSPRCCLVEWEVLLFWTGCWVMRAPWDLIALLPWLLILHCLLGPLVSLWYMVNMLFNYLVLLNIALLLELWFQAQSPGCVHFLWSSSGEMSSLWDIVKCVGGRAIEHAFIASGRWLMGQLFGTGSSGEPMFCFYNDLDLMGVDSNK